MVFGGTPKWAFRPNSRMIIRECRPTLSRPVTCRAALGRTISRVLPLRRDAFEPELAGMGEDGRAIALDMLVEPDTGAGLGQDRCERGLADLKRITPQVIAVQLDQIESV